MRKLDSNQLYAGFTHLPFLLVFHKIEIIMEEKFIISPRQNIVFPWKKAERPFKPRNMYGGLFQTAASQLAPSLLHGQLSRWLTWRQVPDMGPARKSGATLLFHHLPTPPGPVSSGTSVFHFKWLM